MMLTTKEAPEHPSTARPTTLVFQPQAMLDWMGSRDMVIKAKRGVEGSAAQETGPVLPVEDSHRKRHADLVLLTGNRSPNSFRACGQKAIDAHYALEKIMRHIAAGSVPPAREYGDHSLRLPQGHARNSLFGGHDDHTSKNTNKTKRSPS